MPEITGEACPILWEYVMLDKLMKACCSYKHG